MRKFVWLVLICAVCLLIKNSSVSADVAVGTIPGSFDVSLAGSTSYSVPIKIAPGSAGTQPQIQLSYDSQSLAGALGAGWSLQGLSAITRGPRDKFVDSLPAALNLDDADALYLDGQRIVPVEPATGTGKERQLKYRKVNDDFTEIVQFGPDLQTSYFRVRTKGGLTLVFGNPTILSNLPIDPRALDATIRVANNSVLVFAQSAVIDSAGNFITFHYESNQNGDYNISEIRYTGHGTLDENARLSVDREPFANVTFSYEAASRSLEVYVGGQLLKKDRRLTDVYSCVFSKPIQGPIRCLGAPPDGVTRRQVSHYKLDYSDTNTASRFVLSRIHMFGEDDQAEISPTSFSYTNPDLGWQTSPFQLPLGAVLAETQRLSSGYRFGHFAPDASGTIDLLFSAQIDGKNVAFAFKNRGSASWIAGGEPWSLASGTDASDFAPPVPFVGSDGSDLGVIVRDVTGNGRVALIQNNQAGQTITSSAYLAGPKKFEPSPEYKIPFVVSRDGKVIAKYRFANWTRAAGPDLLFESDSQRGFLRNGGAGTGWIADDRYSPPISLDATSHLIDFDCAGGPPLLLGVSSENGALEWRVFRFGAAGWVEELRPQFKPPIPPSINPEAVREIRFGANTASCSGLLVSTAEGTGIHKALQPSANGWVDLPGKTPPFDLVDFNGRAAQAVIANLTDDGFQGVFANTSLPGGSSVAFAYTQDAFGWQNVGANFIPGVEIANSDHTTDPPHIFVGPLVGPKRDDVVVLNDARILKGDSVTERNKKFGRIFTNDGTRFVEQGEFAPPVAFARQDKQDLGVRFVDLHGTGLPDVIFSRMVTKDGQSTLISGAFRNTGRGWIPEPGQCNTINFDISSENPSLPGGLCPPVPFSGSDITGNPIQFVDLDNDGYLDLIYSYKNKTNKTITKTYFNISDGHGGRKWSDQSPDQTGTVDYALPADSTPFASYGVGDRGVRFAKFDTNRIGILVGFRSPGAVECIFRGLVPQCALQPGPVRSKAYSFDGIRWIEKPQYAPPLPFVTQRTSDAEASIDLLVQLLDVTGAGLPALVASFTDPVTNQTTNKTWLNFGNGWDGSNAIQVPYPLDAIYREPKTLVQFSDVNGDGLPDIVLTKGACAGCSKVWLGTGKGWIAQSAFQIPSSAISDKDGDPGFRLVDTNGDGYPDVLWMRQKDDGSIDKGLLLNNGRDWNTRAADEVVPSMPFINKDGVDQGVRLLSVTGKGLTDIIQSFAGRSQSVQLNRSRRADIIKSVKDGYGLTTSVWYQTLLEIDGSDANSGIGNTSPLGWRVYERDADTVFPLLAAVPTTYVVRRAKVDEGNGRTVDFSYRYGKYRVDGDATRSLGFGWRESLNETSNVLTRTEMVQDARMRSGVAQESSCIVNQSALRRLVDRDISTQGRGLQFPTNLCPEGTRSGFEWGYKISQTTNCWRVLEGDAAGRVNQTVLPASNDCGLSAASSPLSGFIIRQGAISKATSTTFEVDGGLVSSATETFSYDDTGSILSRHGNVVSTSSVLADGSAVTTHNEYSDDAKRWYLGRLVRSAVTKKRFVSSEAGQVEETEVRCSGFDYDKLTGLLSLQITNCNTRRAVVAELVRDRFGNVVEKVVSSDRELTRMTKSEFDPLGRYEIVAVNELGHRSFAERDSATGQALARIDPNGLKTSFKYDGFGRLTEQVSPTGVKTKSALVDAVPGALPSIDAERDISSGLSVPVRYAIRTQLGALSPTWALFDIKGRQIRQVTDGFTPQENGTRFIFKEAEYDQLGRVLRESIPHDATELPRWTTNELDDLGRVCASTAINGVRTETLFLSLPSGGARVLVVTDPKRQLSSPPREGGRGPTLSCGRPMPTRLYREHGALEQRSSSEINMRKELMNSSDALGKVTFVYDVGGRLLKRVGPTGAAVVNKYDDLGNKVSVSDPDLGTWNYEYDAFGRAVHQTDAKGQRSTIEYDAVGRPTRRNRGDVSTSWHYDAAKNGVGLVNSIENSNGYKEDVYYDGFGRLASQAITVDREQFTTTRHYDELGRSTKVSYPSSLTVQNKYDSKGYFVSVSDAYSGKLYWRATNIDALGRTLDETFGNGVTTVNRFDQSNERLHSTKTQAKNGKTILDLSLQYDLVGNLADRSEKTQGKKERFEYDELNRLAAFVDEHARSTYRYDVEGRMTYKSGVGKYIYANVSADGISEHPFHAVLETKHGRRSHHYKYDRNGNMLSAPQGHFDYTADNHLKVAYIDENKWSSFDYGPSGDRFRQFARKDLTTEVTLYLGLFEKVTEYLPSKSSDHAYPSKFSGFERLTRSRHYIANGTRVFAVLETDDKFANSSLSNPDAWKGKRTITESWYLHTDQLGSVVRITDEQGKLRQQYWYDPWGSRTGTKREPKSGIHLANSWKRGFTAHEHIDAFSLIHMNGRVYSPGLSAFLSADTVDLIGADTQRGSSYSYARNNPLRYIDPTGMDFLGIGRAATGIWRGVTHAAGQVWNGVTHFGGEVGKWFSENWKVIVVIVVVVVVTYLTLGTGTAESITLGQAILAGAAAGAAGSATSTALYGGSPSDIIESAIKGAVIGGISAAAFYGVGAYFSSTIETSSSSQIGSMAAHGVVGGAKAAAEGGDFWRGFVATAATKASSMYGPDFHNLAGNTARAAVVGGSVAAISGDKFANGAVTGAFSYAFNDYLHRASFAVKGAAMGGPAGAVIATGACLAATDGACVLAAPEVAQEGFIAGTMIGGALGWIYGTVTDIFSGNFYSSSISWQGTPGSSVTITNPDGTPKQTRTYGPDGYPVRDVDYNHDHGQGKPHVHEVTRPPNGSPPTHENRQPGRPQTPDGK